MSPIGGPCELRQIPSQIMDPKMDSGCLEPGETLEDQYDVSRHLLPEEVIGVMDKMLCYEVGVHIADFTKAKHI